MTRLLFLLLVIYSAALCTILGSCAQQTEKTKTSEEALVLNLVTDPPSLDPRDMDDLVSFAVIKTLFEGLMQIDSDDNPVPAVAESVDVSSDYTTYIFKLRKSFWSNGDPVTAHDFVYTWKKTLDPTSPAIGAEQLFVIKNARAAKKGEISLDEVGICATDEHTLVVTLEHPVPYFLELTANPNYYPVNPKVDQATPDWAHSTDNYVSNGPFLLKTWQHDYEIEVVKNKTYWNADAIRLPAIRMVMIQDVETELQLFETGQLDCAGYLLSNLPLDSLQAWEGSNLLHTQPTAGTFLFLFNTQKPPFHNAKFRRALSYAIDRQAIVENLGYPEDAVATELIPPVIAKNPDAVICLYPDNDIDIEKAQRLFQQALVEMHITKDKLDPIVISTNSTSRYLKIAQAIQEQWRKAFDLPVTIESFDFKAFLDKLEKEDYQIGRITLYKRVNDPIDFLENYTEADNTNNLTGWSKIEYTDLITQAKNTSDREKRAALMDQAEKILLNEMPIAPIFHSSATYLKQPYVHNVTMSVLGYHEFRWAYKDVR